MAALQKYREKMEIREHWHGPDRLWTLTCIANDDGFRVASVLVMGREQAVVFDTQWTLSNAHRVVAELHEHGKKPKAIFISHGHPDHYFGTEVFLAAFPGTPVYALEDDIRVIGEQFLPKLDHWKSVIGELNCPTQPLALQPYQPGVLDLDGHEIRIIPHLWGDLKYNSVMWIPAIQTVACSDVVFNMAHPFTCEISDAGRQHWIEDLEKIRALGARVIIPGHAMPGLGFDERGLDFTRDYLVQTTQALESGKRLLASGVPGDRVAQAFYAEMDSFAFDAVLKRSNEMNANVFFAGREWNSLWNPDMDGDAP